ncbi:alpha/beta hydrolase fold-domain-containing protein [Mycena floridula]|nr:alpha/beta hydrolase fold-domain-containing protein [Mycena floridula]
MASERAIHQPLHPSIVPLLDAQYHAFHLETLQYIVPPHTLPWSPSLRDLPAVPGGSPLLDVGKTFDIDLPYCKARVFTPPADIEKPAEGWPVFIFFHGGGWTFGTISSENAFSTNMCVHGRCVVISVDYRLAPEDKYPCAVEDAVDSLKWVWEHGKKELGADLAKIAVGGSSSGGNLAAILSLKALSLDIPVVFQLLIVPVTDNTATVDTAWGPNKDTCWLSPARMEWFKSNYLPNPEDWTKWDASPIFAPTDLLGKAPPAWIAVCELDILRDEGVQYGEKLKEQGVSVEIKVYKGAPHPIMAMDGLLDIGKALVKDAGIALNKAFHGA